MVRSAASDVLSVRADTPRGGAPVGIAGDFRFGADNSRLEIDLPEPVELLRELCPLGVRLTCITAGSPYYNPHIQRPALYPPSDGYRPPEDPPAGVARMIQVTAELKAQFPDLIMVGSGYSYLQEWLPEVSDADVSVNMVDLVGLGRMARSYHDLPLDILQRSGLDRQ